VLALREVSSITNLFEYEKLTWPEIKEAAEKDKVVMLPIGTLEGHGPHLPIDTDVTIVSAICNATAKRIPDEVLLMPTVTHGYSPHHMDFPGSTSISWSTYIEYLSDITRSVAHHGFRKILIVNGHGGNTPLGEIAARITIVDMPHVLCGFVSWWDLASVRAVVSHFRESDVTSHACELETSIYLAVDPDHVLLDKAEKDMSSPMSAHIWSDLVGRKPDERFANPIRLTEYWSTLTSNGVRGDPTKATAEKGRRVLDAASGELVEIIRELRQREIRPRVSHH
jgi:creatinine amidohydrolase